MKAEAILRSDVLDILFEDRNKEYGAYTLRKYYHSRLLQALCGTIALAAIFVLLQGLKPENNNAGSFAYLDTMRLIDVDMKQPQIEKPVEKPRQQAMPAPTIQNVTPRIVDEPVKPEIPTTDDIAGRTISNVTNNLPAGIGDPPLVPGDQHGTQKVITPAPAPVYTGPLETADVMPSFNGDIQRFMLRHLRQPDDLEAGERIVIRVKFVVNEEGAISDIELVQSGRKDLDEEVIRVIRKMPRWNPGKQAGRPVPVFFNMPVTFVNQSE